MNRTRKWLDQWNEDEALWRRYEELRLDFRLFLSDSLYLDEEIDDWAWSEAVKARGPLDCVGFMVGTGGNH
jgi:hypothetical protein